MKFTILEPLNQRINEALKKHNLTKINEKSNSKRVIEEKLNDTNELVERMFDNTNETCSQVFIRTNSNSEKYANVFITDKDEPDYNEVFVVTQ